MRDSNLPLAGTVELHFTYDEETGGAIGPTWLLEQGLSKPDLVISAGFSYAVVTAHSGCPHLEVELRGQSAHAACPETRSDALAAATEVLRANYGLRDSLSEIHSSIDGIDCPSITVGLIDGGINTNVVPDKVTFRLDRRIIPEESPDAVEADLRELIEEAIDNLDGIRVSILRIMLALPLAPLAGVERAVATLRRTANEVFGTEVGVNGVPLYTDARLYMEAGIPTVIYGAGPRSLLEANGHRADERLQLDDLKKATTVFARALV